ncbi:DUF72 domain-containing protein [Pleurocapsales cyanobacterium LEGE 10410]|nr:DUF72 domain-containing protein [Pleurocapsales cyanobacterium LEGE 10410]
MNFYLGCAIWSYKDWVGELYPPKSKSQDFLNLYSRRFTTVEGNTTFYAVPSQATIEKWRGQTPPGFKFCPKLNRQITHQGLLSPRIPDALSFLSRMSGLGDRLGTIFIQLPPSYSPEYLKDLTEFLTACSQSGLSLALEVRHLDWFQTAHGDRLNSLLANLNLARVLLDTRPIYNCPGDPQTGSRRRKPQVPLQPIVTGNVGFIRLITHPNPQYNSYLEQWANQVSDWLTQGKTIYFFVHCPQESRSPSTAKYFHSLIEKRIPSLSLPWNQISHSTQLSLF